MPTSNLQRRPSSREAELATSPPPPAPAGALVAEEPAAQKPTTAGVLPAAAGLLLLAVLVLAGLRPDSPLFWAPVTVIAAIVLLWRHARRAATELERHFAPLEADNARLAEELERLSDTAWELRESEERYRSVIDAQGDLVVLRDRDGRVRFLSPAFASAFGLDAESVVGRPLQFGPAAKPALGPDVTATDVSIATDEGPRWYSWIDIPVRDAEGKLGPYYSVARDITARKQGEQAHEDARQKAETANLAKSQLLATVSHEFRTPLNGILGLTGLLRESGLTPDQQTYARGVQSAGEALLGLVDDMLDFSRIEAGRLELRPEPTALEPLVQDIVELVAARAHGKGIDVAADVDPEAPVVGVDPVRLRQVLINLVGNGVKFTDSGGVAVMVTYGGLDRGKARLTFAVADTGPGIAPEGAGRLFGEFEQGDSTINRRHGGAGLGLAICRRIVRRMGGDIRLAAAHGQGARLEFNLALPVAGGGEAPGRPLEGKRVLILATGGVEHALAARQLERAGAEARVVTNLQPAGGLAAAAVAAGQDYHAVLIDGRWPSGPAAALSQLREAAGSRLPAAVLIEPGRRGDIAALRSHGFDAYLVRPLRQTSLLRVVGDIMVSTAGFRGDPGDEQKAEPAPSPTVTKSLDVLVAEDNEINALLARSVLERLGHKVTEVRNGAAALAVISARETPFDAVFMDLHMPELDGLAAARGIRASEAERRLPPVPVLALTADVLPETREAAEAAGITAVLQKPFTPETLRKALGDIIP